jgi:flagellar basal-body rod protein FlgC
MINFIAGIDSSSAALNAERTRMEVIAQNIANADVTHGVDGQPYQRQSVVFESVLRDKEQSLQALGAQPKLLQVARIEKDRRPFKTVYNPDHVDADATGFVSMPNVNAHEEMADLIAASRSYEANLSVIRTARTMAIQSLSIGKR